MKTINLQLRNLTAIIIVVFLTSALNAQVTLPLNEDFNGWHDASGWHITTGWTVQTTSDWNFDTIDETFPTATNGYMYMNQGTDFGTIKTITTPEIDLTGITNGVELTWYHSLTSTTLNIEVLVEMSVDHGTTWTTVRTITGAFPIQEATEDLSSAIGSNTSLILRWSIRYINGSGLSAKWAIDDISIREITATDVGVSTITLPVSGCSLNNEIVTIEVKNYGTNPISVDIPVEFSTDGGSSWTNEVLTGGVGSGQTEVYTFTATANLSTVQTYDFRARTVLSGDEAPINDEKSMTITNEQSITSFPYEEDFETSDGSWYAVNGTTISSWEWGAPNSINLIGGANGSTNAWVTNLTGNHLLGENSYVYSPCFDLATINNPVIEFDLWYNADNDGYGSYDGMLLEYSLDYGQTWVTIGGVGTGENWYEQPTGWYGQVNWAHAKHELPDLANETNVKFRFYMSTPDIPWTSPQDGYAFDNIKVYDKPAYDVGVTAWISPEGDCGMGNQEMVRIEVTNFGTDDVTNIPLELSIDGGVTFVQDTLTATVTAGTVGQHIFYLPAVLSDFSTPGIYNCIVKTTLSADGNNLNDILNYDLVSKPIYDSEITEDFENDYAGYWSTYLEFGTINNWEHGVPMGDTINIASSGTKAWVTNLDGIVSTNQTSYVESPCYDLTNINFACFEFNIALNTYTQGSMSVEYSIDEGLNWILMPGIPSYWDQTMWYPNNWTKFVGDFNAGEWQTKVRPFTDINDLNNNPASVKFRVKFEQGSQFATEGVAFDDVRIYSDESLWLATNLENSRITESLNIFPNPATELINITVRNIELGTLINIIDVTGNIAIQKIVEQNNLSIDISSLENGIYFVKIGDSVQKFIKN